MSAPGGMAVGPGDAARCALGLLLPSWFYAAGLVTGVAAVSGGWSNAVNTGAAFAGFAFAAAVEGLRRVVLASRPDGGRGATALLRAVVGCLPLLGVGSACVLAAALANRCAGAGCGDEARIAVWLWLALCLLCLATTPLLVHLFRRSAWLQPRTG